MKAVRSGNEIAYVGHNSWWVRQELIRGHYEAQKRGSWSAFFKPKDQIYEVELFQATNQYFEEVNRFWLQVENDADACAILEQERDYIFAQRKTLKGRVNMALDRGKIVRHKLFKCIRGNDNALDSFNFSMTRVFGAVFASHIVGQETPKIKAILHGITSAVLFWEEAVWGNDWEDGALLSFREGEAKLHLKPQQVVELTKDINDILRKWGNTRYGVILKNDNDELGVILERVNGGEIIDSYQFWFEDYRS